MAKDKAAAKPSELSLADFFSATDARRDRWSQLAACADAWGAGRGSSDKLATEIVTLLDELEPLEQYWAFPGPALMRTVRELVSGGDAQGLATALNRIKSSIFSGSYRRDPSAWNIDEEAESNFADRLPPGLASEAAQRPYFELLVVAPESVRAGSGASPRELHKLRRPEDPFIYESVPVGSFEDAVVAAIINTNLQAVVVYDGFPYKSRHALTALGRLLQRFGIEDDGMPTSYGLSLARAIKKIRPELDIYLVSERSVEAAATSEQSRLVRRVFYEMEELLEVHLSILAGITERYTTPFFDNLKKYAARPIGTFHALPVARGKSIFKSNWIKDMGQFYGANLFLAESSATTGGLDSLLDPAGNIKDAQDKAARAFGADKVFFGTNGTSTSNKIVVQALCQPGDIILIDRNCHKSHHYGLVLAGSQPLYLEAYPMVEYSMYGAVPLRTIKQALLTLKAEGKLDKARVLDLTNCTFDGHMYNCRRVMEECLAIKPDLVFLWDEAWFGFARFSPFHRRRTAMGAAQRLEEMLGSPEYRKRYDEWKAKMKGKVGKDLDPNDASLLDTHLLPDPDTARIRVYQTNSTHKSMSALRQGSMIAVRDQDFHKVEEQFHEAFYTHTSTSPNQQIIASLDLARRQMELEGYELVMNAIDLALDLRRQVNSHPMISKYFHILTPGEMVPAEFRASGVEDYGRANGGATWEKVIDAWEEDEFALDPTRLTVVTGRAGYDGTQFKGLLASKYDVQINKTSRNSILVQTNINNTRSDVAHLLKVLADCAREVEQRLQEADAVEKEAFAARVKSLMEDVPDLPNFSRFHDAFRDSVESGTSQGHMRAAFFTAYREHDCEHIKLQDPQIDERVRSGPPLVSANFVIPYPPGFPIMVPGQVIEADTITFMRKLDVKEIHGYNASLGLKLLKPDSLGKRAKKGAATDL
ncbi:aminotransferase class I/II-fold pyridoxal phosphate-dependent enzyme [Ramlibacter ginsenosidimutans]|uniref:Aminotransferase class I/II-fold pyridoxal phosphate-dependent enzyme n=1 Tax=Ramlibacter ginsenosidimutans TaxID=502333 RepID=A0A934TWB9_9BURK|nr:aminotransferase class I/II-fold pyridoxal phosphate-dependent enzyme [Ramlibacter ginsenosidimutans]MBK6008520.1 aminotransferase class I/II-fold pyridoxal phosphate-dependent enzyme [Ramlibacter ginsenosidimutans]